MIDKLIQVLIRHVAGVRCQLHLAGKLPGLGAQLSGFFHQPFCQTAGRSFQLCAVGKTGVDLLHQGCSLLRILVHRSGQHAAAPGQHSQRQCRRHKCRQDHPCVFHAVVSPFEPFFSMIPFLQPDRKCFPQQKSCRTKMCGSLIQGILEGPIPAAGARLRAHWKAVRRDALCLNTSRP